MTTTTTTTTGTRFVIDLRDAAACDPTAVGSKAATLAALAARGFPVPPGFVVTTAATQRLRSNAHGRDDRAAPRTVAFEDSNQAFRKIGRDVP